MSSRHPPTSRPRPSPIGEEQATSVLDLGDFQNVETLSLSEVSLVLNLVAAQREKQGKLPRENKYVLYVCFIGVFLWKGETG